MGKKNNEIVHTAQYPCVKCTSECDTDSVLCCSCDRWVHSYCVPMSANLLAAWSQRNMQFYCPECCMKDGHFDFHKSLIRLKAAIQQDNRILGAENEKLLLITYNVLDLNKSQGQNDHHNIDSIASSILEIFHPVLLSEFVPLAITGDGNCLYRTLSLAATGNQHQHVQLRVLSAIEIMLNKQFYDINHRKYADPIKDMRVVCSDYNKLIESTITLGSFSEMLHMYALSTVLSKPITSYYPPMISSTFHSEPFTRKIIGRDINQSMPSIATVMWTQVTMPKSARNFSPNHFILLHEKIGQSNDEIPSISLDSEIFVENREEIVETPLETEILDSNSDLMCDTSNDQEDIYMSSSSENDSDTDTEYVFLDNDQIDRMNEEYRQEQLQQLKSVETLHNLSSDNSLGTELPEGRFLDTETVYSLLLNATDALDNIPYGPKDNKYFIVKNDRNDIRRQNNKKSCFADDCGVWNSANGATPKTTYILSETNSLKKIFVRNGVYCTEKMRNKKRIYDPIIPPPPEESLVEIYRYYATLKASQNFKKRVSWMGHGGNNSIAVIEYIGTFPGLRQHGNAKSAESYTRTNDKVMTEIGNMVKTMRPMDVYRKLNMAHDELSAPANPRQVRDKKRREKLKEEKRDGQFSYTKNIADHFVQVQNMVKERHPFVRQILHDSGRVPSIMLYTDEQMNDLKKLCCSGQTLLGFDKTFNLCDMHVTASCFKQLSVTKLDTGEHPLFLGPLFVHDSSDFETYSAFFAHLKIKLTSKSSDFRNLVIGTDDEQALKKAITSVFPESTHVLCTRHLKQNINDKLSNIGVHKQDRQKLVNSIFGQDGILDADDSIVFEEKCEEVVILSQSLSPEFTHYFKNRLQPLLKEKVHEPERAGRVDKMWTNNNCESINHVLKQTIDWKSKSLLDFIEVTHTTVCCQYKDLRRALLGTGQYRLAASHRHFLTEKMRWASLTGDQRSRLLSKFLSYAITDKGTVTSTDGQSAFRMPRTLGKKPGQRKRKRAERTATVTKKLPQ